ncbi:MAG: large conductance mechanosensitive channel protein MscL [Saprospiraceae bacterium]|nr:large conductance mechanosensitive channel protein MscL [Saprospiraceae bacterium]
MFKEFKEFAIQGNLVEIAVGLIMATGFGAVTAAFVDGIVMPVVGNIFQIGDLNAAKILLAPEVKDATGAVTTPESSIYYGKFISTFINFLIIAFVMFLILKSVHKLKKENTAPAG